MVPPVALAVQGERTQFPQALVWAVTMVAAAVLATVLVLVATQTKATAPCELYGPDVQEHSHQQMFVQLKVKRRNHVFIHPS